jgi:polysaccharide biosynthesis protein PslH
VSSGGAVEGTRRRVLVLAPFPPRLDGKHGGSRAIAQMLLHLTERHDVALVAMRSAMEPPVDATLRARCALVEEVERTWSGDRKVRQRLRLLSGLLRGTPAMLSRWESPRMADVVRRVTSDFQPEVVQIEMQVMVQHAGEVPAGVVRLLVVHEPAAAMRDMATQSSLLARAVQLLNARAMRRAEQWMLSQVDGAVVFTERDRRNVEAPRVSTPVWTIPLGAELPRHALDPAGTDGNRVLFFGNFIHAPNADAAEWLMEEIMPAVRERVPDATLEIVGSNPPARFQQRAGPGVFITGEVPDISPRLNAAAVVALPIRLGGGMRVKLLEALGAGKAIVCSSLCAEGLSLTSGRQVLVADESEQFAEAVAILLRDAERRAELGRAARDWAKAHLTWPSRIAEYEQVYTSLMRARTAGTAHPTAGREALRP